jgi:hypothetical protein
MSKKLSAAVLAIIDVHASQAKVGAVALANPREGFAELHFHIEEEVHKGVTISETKVLRSNAGHYIGHDYLECPEELGAEFCYWAPYDRISGYYATHEAAAIDLELYKKALGH